MYGYLEKGIQPPPRLVHLIITMIKWIRTSRLSINNSLYLRVFVASSKWAVPWLTERLCKVTPVILHGLGIQPRVG